MSHSQCVHNEIHVETPASAGAAGSGLWVSAVDHGLTFRSRPSLGGGPERGGTNPCATSSGIRSRIAHVSLTQRHFWKGRRAALEAVSLILLIVLSWPRFCTIPRRLRKQPYVTSCLTYILFGFIFAVVQDFVIFARQRVLV